ncbi:MAG: tetratricopeptide repeat protein [Alphaproteobacteria bacterium]
MIDFDATLHLKSVSMMPDEDINIGVTALAMVADDHVGVSVHRYIQILEKIQNQVGARYRELLTEGADDDAGVRIAALKHVIYDRHGYYSDDGEPLEGADLMRVLDQGKGCSTALCILYMDAARAQGWRIYGLDFPSRYLCRIEHMAQRLIFDPSELCKVMEAHDLRAMVKDALGVAAELSTGYYDAQDARGSIVHLCNHLKSRRIEMGEYREAVIMIERMRIVAPDEYRLLLDAGVLYMRLNENERAVVCLEEYIEKCEDVYDRHEAELLLRDIPRS